MILHVGMQCWTSISVHIKPAALRKLNQQVLASIKPGRRRLGVHDISAAKQLPFQCVCVYDLLSLFHVVPTACCT